MRGQPETCLQHRWHPRWQSRRAQLRQPWPWQATQRTVSHALPSGTPGLGKEAPQSHAEKLVRQAESEVTGRCPGRRARQQGGEKVRGHLQAATAYIMLSPVEVALDGVHLQVREVVVLQVQAKN